MKKLRVLICALLCLSLALGACGQETTEEAIAEAEAPAPAISPKYLGHMLYTHGKMVAIPNFYFSDKLWHWFQQFS